MMCKPEAIVENQPISAFGLDSAFDLVSARSMAMNPMKREIALIQINKFGGISKRRCNRRNTGESPRLLNALLTVRSIRPKSLGCVSYSEEQTISCGTHHRHIGGLTCSEGSGPDD